MELTNRQWEYLQQFLPENPVREDKRGRPWKDARAIVEGILWIMRTGAPWKDLPSRYGAYQTVHRRFQQWREQGVMETLFRELAEDLRRHGGIDVRECFIDGSFAAAKKGALELAPPSEARAPRSWQLRTLLVFQSPLAQQALLRPK